MTTLSFVAVAAYEALLAESKYMQAAPAWTIVNVWLSALTEPVREVLFRFASTV